MKNAIQAENILAKYGFTRSVSHTRQIIIILLFVGLSALLAWVMGILGELVKSPTTFSWERITSRSWSQLTSFSWSSAISLGVAIIVYHQWRLARYEISIDKYYDRLETTNKRLELLRTGIEDKYNMHVFAELDKLEYVIYKYDLGFISPILAARAADNFKRWCLVKEEWKKLENDTVVAKGEYKFRRWAVDWVNNAAYDPKTREIVEEIRKYADQEGKEV